MSTTESSSLTPEQIEQIAREQGVGARGVAAVLELMAGGATVPFIARYRKERTGGLDEVQIRAVQERAQYIGELEARRQTILKSIDEQGKLTVELRKAVEGAGSKVELEDLYLPYKPKRRTRATMARERGLEPLAEQILAQLDLGNPERAATDFVAPDEEVPDIEAALQGALDIVAEVIAETAPVRAGIREHCRQQGEMTSKPARGQSGEPTKFEQYYDFSEPVRSIPSHRLLALLRGEREKVLSVSLAVDEDPVIGRTLRYMGHRPGSPFGEQLRMATEDGIKRLVLPSVEKEIRAELKERADASAVEVFATNLRNLLLAAPLGQRSVVGIDPGLRTGCKCAAVDATGRYLETITIYPVQDEGRAAAQLAAFLKTHRPHAVAVGNGTGGRETLALARKVAGEAGLDAVVVEVNEAGASVYSASDVARQEHPDLDLTVRGAISIGRRLQDPLAELVKIDPKSIGVGQYQHDVHQPLLQKKLEEVVEDCVNHVGVTINTASAPLLAHVAGIGPKLSERIVTHRNEVGPFERRDDLLRISGLGAKTFQQAAGFLRIPGGEHPLDASAVHPERYSLVERMARDLGVSLSRLVGDSALAGTIDIRRYIDESVGEPTLKDIVAELSKPGRDPRETFEAPAWRDDVTTMEDLREGMALPGVVTNVTHFGAFVDIGVHQDGLVHVSELADRFVKDPNEVVKVGDKLQVRVIGVDLARKRISLSARKERPEERRQAGGGERKPPAEKRGGRGDKRGGPKRSGKPQPPRPANKPSGGPLTHNPFADLLKRD